MNHKQSMREAIESLQGTPSTPFIDQRQKAFSLLPSKGRPTSQRRLSTLFVYEEEYLPTKRQVRSKGKFACCVRVYGALIRSGTTSVLKLKMSEPKLLALSAWSDDKTTEAGYQRLVSGARRLMADERDRAFLDTLEQAIESIDRRPSELLVIRFRPINQSLLARLGRLTEEGKVAAVLGCDLSHPYLGDRFLVGNAAARLVNANDPFLCPTDALVATALGPLERTGLFWPFPPPPIANTSPYEFAACYARLHASEHYAAVRLDIIVPRDAAPPDAPQRDHLGAWTDRAIQHLCAFKFIAADAEILRDLGDESIPLPVQLTDLFREVIMHKDKAYSPLKAVYAS
jgi:hypothetical protein